MLGPPCAVVLPFHVSHIVLNSCRLGELIFFTEFSKFVDFLQGQRTGSSTLNFDVELAQLM